jgi:hypothetical protein
MPWASASSAGQRRAVATVSCADRGHARMERNVHVGLGHAEEAPPRAHDAEVVSQGEQRPGSERVPVDRCDGSGGEDQHATEQGEHVLQIDARCLWTDGGHVLEIEPVGVEAVRPHGHEGPGTLGGLHLVEDVAPGLEALRREAVLPVVHPHAVDLAVTLEIDHFGAA